MKSKEFVISERMEHKNYSRADLKQNIKRSINTERTMAKTKPISTKKARAATPLKRSTPLTQLQSNKPMSSKQDFILKFNRLISYDY